MNELDTRQNKSDLSKEFAIEAMTEKESKLFARDNIRLYFGYAITCFALIIVSIILLFGDALKLSIKQEVAWTLFVTIATAGVSFVFSSENKNDER
jgi:hypothetical protein